MLCVGSEDEPYARAYRRLSGLPLCAVCPVSLRNSIEQLITSEQWFNLVPCTAQDHSRSSPWIISWFDDPPGPFPVTVAID